MSLTGPVLAHIASTIEKIRDLGTRLCDELEDSLRETLTYTYEWNVASVILTYQDYFDAHVACVLEPLLLGCTNDPGCIHGGLCSTFGQTRENCWLTHSKTSITY